MRNLLTFSDGASARTAVNGQQVELVVDGIESLGINLFTVERGTAGCTDGPGAGLDTTWLFHDNSF